MLSKNLAIPATLYKEIIHRRNPDWAMVSDYFTNTLSTDFLRHESLHEIHLQALQNNEEPLFFKKISQYLLRPESLNNLTLLNLAITEIGALRHVPEEAIHLLEYHLFINNRDPQFFHRALLHNASITDLSDTELLRITDHITQGEDHSHAGTINTIDTPYLQRLADLLVKNGHNNTLLYALLKQNIENAAPHSTKRVLYISYTIESIITNKIHLNENIRQLSETKEYRELLHLLNRLRIELANLKIIEPADKEERSSMGKLAISLGSIQAILSRNNHLFGYDITATAQEAFLAYAQIIIPGIHQEDHPDFD